MKIKIGQSSFEANAKNTLGTFAGSFAGGAVLTQVFDQGAPFLLKHFSLSDVGFIWGAGSVTLFMAVSRLAEKNPSLRSFAGFGALLLGLYAGSEASHWGTLQMHGPAFAQWERDVERIKAPPMPTAVAAPRQNKPSPAPAG